MKRKFFIASLVLMGASMVANAQGYKDGIEYYKVDKLDNAKELLERNLNAASTDKAEAYYYLGQIALHQGNATQAADYFAQGISANAMNPYNYVGQAALALKKGSGDVKALLDKARKLSKKDPKLEIEIARAYYDANPTTYAKDIDKCIKNARKWNADDPDSYIFEADTKADMKDWGNAAGIYELAFDKDPKNIEAYVKYANTYFNVVPEMAIGRLEELQAKVPNSALVQRELAEMYYADNLGAKAAEQYGRYIKNPNHFAQDEVRYVQLLFFGEKYQESLDLATSLVNKLNPSDSKVFFMKRMQLYNLVQLERWDEAVEAGRSFFANAMPKDAKYEVRDYTDYGQALQNAGRPEEAISAYEKAIELNPNNADLIRFMGDSYADAENYEKAAEYYQRLVDEGINKSNDLYLLSRYYLNYAGSEGIDPIKKNEAVAKAQKYVEEVDKLVPNNVLIVNQKANVARFIEGDNNTGAAVGIYNELLNLLESKDDKDSYQRYFRSAYLYLGNYYFNKGDKATAKSYYQECLKYDPENEALRKYVNNMK
ncbi:MAG: tetratricopeptide repeat protein [Muribaculaceae bacterium]|nr:tetratricopeptide repeat protein [Muribaculaceae bacterium]